MTDSQEGLKLNGIRIAACILDMDGVVTDTARLHARAWQRMFNEFLEQRGKKFDEYLPPFDIEWDYRRYVDGKPRYDGVKSFLDARGIALPFGGPEDPPDRETICGLGNRKNGYFLAILEKERIEPYTSTVDFINQGRRRGIRFALISASRNAGKVLEAAGLSELFRVVVDGMVAEELKLQGKPQPDIFLEAAARLNVPPASTMVVEDAQAGVEAAKNGGFALVVGIDRTGEGGELRKYGADLVVRDLTDFTIGNEGFAPKLPSALEEEEAIIERLRDGVPAIFLDYDGTLTRIVDDPSRAEFDEEMRQQVWQIAEHWFVAVISGRGLADVRARVGIENVVYAGSHGFEASSGSGYFNDHPEREEYLRALDRAEKELGEYARELPGVQVERKKFAIAVHYRRAEEKSVPPLEKKVDEMAGQSSGRLKKTGGKKIFELRPDVNWDKGRALEAMIEKFHIDCSRVIPLYIGDDTTDEDAFRAVGGGRGIGILVSSNDRATAADYLLRDPREVAVFLRKMADMAGRGEGGANWSLTYDHFDPEKEKLREALCTTGNGYFATRGAAAESVAGREHYPGTYIAGCYNRLTSTVDGETIENESLVNAPNWLPLTFRLEDGEWFDIRAVRRAGYKQELDMAAGVLKRTIRFTDEKQRDIRFSEQRFVSMDAPHLAAMLVEIRIRNWSGNIYIHSALDGRVENSLVKRYRPLNNSHLEQVVAGCSEDNRILWLQARTSQSHILIAEACRTSLFMDGEASDLQRRTLQKPDYIGQELAVMVEDGRPVRIEKITAIYHSRDRAITESLAEAKQAVAGASDFNELLREHRRAWRHLWERCSINIRMAGERISRILNLHIFHLLQTVSIHSIDLDIGVPPRGLHGEAYRGLIMWDELFVFPFLNLRIPDLTRALLQYRYRRLPRARQMAKAAGLRGAMFPWQSGSNGREEAQTLHLNPQSGHWIPDNSQLQRHINIAVGYNVWLYYQVTGDLDFMSFYGAELIIETARFWVSLVNYNEAIGRYEIKGVMGPDEFHTGYPGATEPGLDNNAYTNVMAVWIICRALDVLEILPEHRRRALWENLSLREQELEKWDDISRGMRLDFHDDGIISQFEGYDRLEEFDWAKYREKYGNIHRLDRILEAEGDTTDRYKLSKQADVLMLFYLLSADELRQIFSRLGYPFEYDTIPRNIEYYLKRTAHGSTLSRVVHAWVLARSKRKQSWNLFCDAAEKRHHRYPGRHNP